MLRYASSEPPLRPSPRTLTCLNDTIGSLKPAIPSDAHADIPAIATSINPSLVLRLILRMLVLLAFVRRFRRRTRVVRSICGRPLVTLRGRRRGHFRLQISPPLEAFRDLLLE